MSYSYSYVRNYVIRKGAEDEYVRLVNKCFYVSDIPDFTMVIDYIFMCRSSQDDRLIAVIFGDCHTVSSVFAYNACVLPEFRKHGIMSNLIRYALGTLTALNKQIRTIYATAGAEHAIFYGKFNFKYDGTYILKCTRQ